MDQFDERGLRWARSRLTDEMSVGCCFFFQLAFLTGIIGSPVEMYITEREKKKTE